MLKANKKLKNGSVTDASRTVQQKKVKKKSNQVIEDHEDHPDIVGSGWKASHSPLEFETFVPWVCRRWGASTTVIVTQKYQEQNDRKSSSKQQQQQQQEQQLDKPKLEEPLKDSKLIPESSSNTLTTSNSDALMVPVTAYYDGKRLVEIAIVGSKVKASRKVIAAISLAVPYHSSLTRFTFQRSYLTAELIYDISKLLPISNISEIIFDDSYVQEANYHILLEQLSQLNYLSLNRCKINDEACKKIFENISFDAPASKSLQLLELGSNDITDEGAIFIGSVLRSNRSLVHLNLSGNKITDTGFISILDSLVEFPLDIKEKYAMRHRKLRYLQNKAAVYERCLKNLKSGNSGSSGNRSLMKRLRIKPNKSALNIEEEAEMMTRAILGEFHDPFSPEDVVFKNDTTYCKGNFVLCYINVAYNHLEYRSLRKLHEVLRYQDEMRMRHQLVKGTGLIRVTLDGNNIPQTCRVLQEIDFYLKKVICLRMLPGLHIRPSRNKGFLFGSRQGSGTSNKSQETHHTNII